MNKHKMNKMEGGDLGGINTLPSPMEHVRRVLEQFGGWSRMFRKSSITYDSEVIYYRDDEAGFWGEWAKVRANEIFEEEVETCVIELKRIHRDRRDKDELRKLLAKALLTEGWKPPKTKILKEIRDLRRKKREDISCLKSSLQRMGKKK